MTRLAFLAALLATISLAHSRYFGFNQAESEESCQVPYPARCAEPENTQETSEPAENDDFGYDPQIGYDIIIF